MNQTTRLWGGRFRKQPDPRLMKLSSAAGEHARLVPQDVAGGKAHAAELGRAGLLTAQELGPKAQCLVDLGHHAPNVNIEMIVARLIRAGKLGGFHFNDSKYGDDDLDAGSIDPYRLFLVFNELVDAELRRAKGFAPAHMLDQSHNVTDPIESLMVSAMEIQRAYAQALLVDREALAGFQEANDALMASETLKGAFRTDVEPILAMARAGKGARARRPTAPVRS